MKYRGLIFFTALVLLTAVLRAALPVNGEAGVYDKLVRLHVVANSDSDEDQALKLKVRDALLEYSHEILSGCKTADEAKAAVEAHRDDIISVCRGVIAENGSDHPVSLKLGFEAYPEKTYGGVTLPSGDYYSVRVIIGEGGGHNWWCVLFPPLCVGAAEEERSVMASAGLTKDEVDLLTDNDGGKYVLKFRIIEFLRRTFTSK